MAFGLRFGFISRGKNLVRPRAGTEQKPGPGETRRASAAAAITAVSSSSTVTADEDDADDEASPGGGAMTVEQVEEFFRTTIKRLTSPEEREDIKSKV